MKQIKSILCAAAVALSGMAAVIPAEAGCALTPSANNNLYITENDVKYFINSREGTVSVSTCTSTAEEIVIPESVEGKPVVGIMRSAFSSCDNTKKLVLPETVTEIANYGLSGMAALEEVNLPAALEKIEGSVLQKCESLETVTLPENITEIGSYAFSGCKSLKTIVIPDKVTTIGGSAFINCEALTEITIPEGVTRIPTFCFSGCTSLTTVNLPSTITAIDAECFALCGKLSKINLPEGLKTINNFAFSNDKSLRTLIIPRSVELITINSFYKCANNADKKFTLGVYKDSYAHQYAVEQKYDYFLVDGENETTEPEVKEPEVKEQANGDFDGDGAVGAEDAQNVLNVYAELIAGNVPELTDAQKKAADVNGDGEIDSADAQYILLYYVQNVITGVPTTWEEIIK
ncbi:MAG: leucine-rich repeat protein [Oscillospiraceae bacterium]|nr:leucine-rich repeat protein [Oscillospiraceae bacterium]